MAEISRGQVNLNTVLGAIGTAGTVSSGNFLGNLFGSGNNGWNSGANAGCATSRYDLENVKEIANKDMEIVYWRGQAETDKKISDSFTVLRGEITDLAKEVRQNKEEQCAINMQQAVYNGTNTATIQCIRNQVEELLALAPRKIPNASVCPGWGEITVTPSTTTTAAAAGT